METTQCPEAWADETGHDHTTNWHRCHEAKGWHDDWRYGGIIHECDCGAYVVEDVY